MINEAALGRGVGNLGITWIEICTRFCRYFQESCNHIKVFRAGIITETIYQSLKNLDKSLKSKGMIF